MRAKHLRSAGALRPEHRPTSRDDHGHDAAGLRAAVSGDRRSALRQRDARLEGFVQPSRVAQPHSGTVPGGWQHPPGTRRADGGAVGIDGGERAARGPRFDAPVAPDGYAWWYVDALSDDGRHGLTIIAFVGSVFSPYYALARSRGAGDPSQHCALNVALYGEGFKRWALTERRSASVRRSRSTLAIGPSSLSWDGTALTIAIDEITFPLPSRIRGTVRLFPAGLCGHAFALDHDGRHLWSPIAPCAQVEVALTAPALRWSGAGYLDGNAGDAPLESVFSRWHWSRASTPTSTLVHYDVDRRDGSNLAFSARFDRSGSVEPLPAPPRVTLPRTGWGIERSTRADPGQKVRIAKTFEDTPFYARSLVAIEGDGGPGMAMHESLSLERFRTRWVKWLLPFRMPRSRR